MEKGIALFDALRRLAKPLGIMAALVLFLGGVLLGAIDDVPTRSVIAAVGLLAGLLGMSISAARLAPSTRSCLGA